MCIALLLEARRDELRRLSPLPVAHFRRAQVHARLGEKEWALRQYAVFLEAWKDADPELPQVRLARNAVAALEVDR